MNSQQNSHNMVSTGTCIEANSYCLFALSFCTGSANKAVVAAGVLLVSCTALLNTRVRSREGGGAGD